MSKLTSFGPVIFWDERGRGDVLGAGTTFSVWITSSFFSARVGAMGRASEAREMKVKSPREAGTGQAPFQG